jgi:hypothetical protein
MPQNAPVPTILIELPDGEGVVRGDDGELVITRDVSDGRGLRLVGGDYRAVKDWLDEGRTLVGGLLAPGAVGAEVIDDAGIKILAAVGAGAYVAILHQSNGGHQPVVCCRDRAGRAVARPLAPDWPRTPVTDADVPCPACGAVAYDEVLPNDGSRGGRGGHGHDGPLQPRPISVCRICGHEEGAGRSITRYGSTDDEPEDETAAAALRERRRAHQQIEKWYLDTLTLRGVACPIYAAENWRAQIGSGWGTLAKPTGAPSTRAPEDVTDLTVDHFTAAAADPFTDPPRLKVTTSVDPSQFGHTQLDHARWVLAIWQNGGTPWPQVSDAALKLWLGARDRQRRAAVHTAAHHLDPAVIELEPIPAPTARLLGPEPDDAQ